MTGDAARRRTAQAALLAALLSAVDGVDLAAVSGDGILFRTPLAAYVANVLRTVDASACEITYEDPEAIPAISMVAMDKSLKDVLDALVAKRLIDYVDKDELRIVVRPGMTWRGAAPARWASSGRRPARAVASGVSPPNPRVLEGAECFLTP